MRRQSIQQWIVTASILGCFALASPAGDSNDNLTGIPLHPGLKFSQELDSPICGKNTRNHLYIVAFDFKANTTAPLAEYLSWYKAHLNGFRHYHRIWNNNPQEMFYSAGGSKGITVTGEVRHNSVISVSYLTFSPAMTAHEMEVFSPTNLKCK